MIEITGRRLAILAMLADGKQATEIGVALGISPRTVKSHLVVVYAQLGAANAAHAVAIALRRGLIE